MDKTNSKNYVGVIKFKSSLPYEEVEGFKYNTGVDDIEEARNILHSISSNLSISNNCQVRWEFEGIGQGHYCDDYWYKSKDSTERNKDENEDEWEPEI